MTFEDLRVFVTVASERSFSRAARKLRRTQPAVSQAIRRLEAAAKSDGVCDAPERNSS